jgi:hypothetical protein
MNPDSQQPVLLPSPALPPGTVLVNDRVSFQTEGQQRVILVCGMFFSHYSVDDPAAEAYAMVTLFESGYADQNDIARCFGYSTRTLRRYQQRLQAGGLRALARLPGRPPPPGLLRPRKSPSATGPSSASRPKKGVIDGLPAGLGSAKPPSARLSVGWVGTPAPNQVLSLFPSSWKRVAAKQTRSWLL